MFNRVWPRKNPGRRTLKVGQRVRIVEGALKDLCGQLVKRMPSSWTIEVECLSDGVYVVVSDDCLLAEERDDGQFLS